MENEVMNMIQSFTEDLKTLLTEAQKADHKKLNELIPILRSTTLKVAPLYSEINPNEKIDDLLLLNYIYKQKLYIASDINETYSMLKNLKQNIYAIYSKVFYLPKNINKYFPVYAACIDFNTTCENLLSLLFSKVNK